MFGSLRSPAAWVRPGILLFFMGRAPRFGILTTTSLLLSCARPPSSPAEERSETDVRAAGRPDAPVESEAEPEAPVDVASFLPAPGTYIFVTDLSDEQESYRVSEREGALCSTRNMTCLRVANGRIEGKTMDPPDSKWGLWLPGQLHEGQPFSDVDFEAIVLSTAATVQTAGGEHAGCLHLRFTYELGDRTSITEEWWARGLGLVRRDEVTSPRRTELSLLRPRAPSKQASVALPSRGPDEAMNFDASVAGL